MLLINLKYPNSLSDKSSYSGRRQYEGMYNITTSITQHENENCGAYEQYLSEIK